MRIKKHPSGNEFIRAGDVWVRNFTKAQHHPVQISHLFGAEDYRTILENEEMNKNHPKISNERLVFRKVVIVSDGYEFEKRHLFLRHLPKDVCVLAVNKALQKWGLYNADTPVQERRTLNGYVINNPYREAMSFMPPPDARYYPTCVASTRTNHHFLRKYMGDVYTYATTPEESFGHDTHEAYYIEDYRNPVCAAIGLAHRFGVERLLLLCCDDSFAERRDFAVPMPNGLWTYPQHLKSHEIIDAKLYWLTRQEDKEVVVADYSSGPVYVNAAYIKSEEEALSFILNNEEGTPDVR